MSEGLTVPEAIEAYQPPRLPERGELRGVVVVIDPRGGGAKDVDQRRWDDLALVTGGHLYHLVHHAGGVPVMTRADDRPMPHVESGAAAALQAICTQRQADLVVTIEFAAGSATELSSLGGDRLSQSLARCLAEVLGVERRAGGRPQRERSSSPGVPGTELRLNSPNNKMASRDRRVFHRGCAERIYRGIAAFVRAERDALGAARKKRFPGPDRRSIDPIPYLPGQTWEEELIQAARRIWPEGNLPIGKAAWFCEMFRRTALSDQSAVYLQLQITVDGDTVVVGGATNIAILRDTLPCVLRAVGVNHVRNDIRLLPEEGRSGDRRFGVCIAPTALTFDQPSEAAGLQSQLLYGEALLLLDHDAGYYLVHGGDGYCGWVREDCVRVTSADEFKRHTAGRRAVLLRDVDLAGRRVVRGATLPVAASQANHMILLCPDGKTFEVADDDVRVNDDSQAAVDRVSRALQLLYRPYVFGGVSPLGLDCSGLVKNVCGQTGLAVARDAARQFSHGRLVATRWYREGIRPGDFLYFINPGGRIFHVGIAISPTHFVHSAPPEVQISSLQAGDRLYCECRERAFFAARRVT